MEIAFQSRPFTVDEYHAMGRAGILKSDERIELLDGEILTMPPIGPPHVGIVNRLTALLTARLGARALIQVQGPVRLANDSEPQPDIAVLQFRDDYYSSRHSAPPDVFALIEVAESSLSYDGGRKLRAYARRNIPEYWIIDVRGSAVNVYREPHGLGYAVEFQASRGQTVAFSSFPRDVFRVEELIG